MKSPSADLFYLFHRSGNKHKLPLCWRWAAHGSGLAQKPNFRQSSVSLVPWLCCCKPSAQLHSQTPALGINHGVAFGRSLFCSTSQLLRLHGPGLRSACQELHHIDSNKTLANSSWPSKSISALGNWGAGSVAVEKVGLWFTSVDMRISVAPVLRGTARGDE